MNDFTIADIFDPNKPILERLIYIIIGLVVGVVYIKKNFNFKKILTRNNESRLKRYKVDVAMMILKEHTQAAIQYMIDIFHNFIEFEISEGRCTLSAQEVLRETNNFTAVVKLTLADLDNEIKKVFLRQEMELPVEKADKFHEFVLDQSDYLAGRFPDMFRRHQDLFFHGLDFFSYSAFVAKQAIDDNSKTIEKILFAVWKKYCWINDNNKKALKEAEEKGR